MKKKSSESKALAKSKSAVSAEMILSHPVFQEMSRRLETVQGMLQNLPAAIGEAVAAAQAQRPPEGASCPPIPLIAPEGDIEIHPRKLMVDGKSYDVQPGWQKKTFVGGNQPFVVEKVRIIDKVKEHGAF